MIPLFAFGSILACAIACGSLGERLRLPRVTAYLLAGVLIGPGVLGLVPLDVLHHFKPIVEMAMALVLFNLGAHFTIAFVGRIRKHLLPVALGDLVFTFGFVTLGLLALQQGYTTSLMLGCLAMATAPATTVLVLKELRSEGPVTELAQALVAVNNLVTIVAFEILLMCLVFQGAFDGQNLAPFAGTLALKFSGSLLVGVVGGLILSYSLGVLSTSAWLTLLIALSAVALGICQTYELFYMFAFLTSGFVFVNTASASATAVSESEKLTGILCVAFFAIHGAELRLNQVAALGLVGVAYIVLRTAGKCIGIHLTARWSHESKELQNWLGSTMLSQAGAAIALSAIAVARDRSQFEHIQSIILGSVVIFEVIGPILIRYSVLQAGEAPIAHAIRHTHQTMSGQLKSMLWQLKIASGADPQPAVTASEIKVADLLRGKVEGILQTADFEQIIFYIEHSHDDTYPVVDAQGSVVGLIRYRHLSQTLFDPRVGKLVRAIDLATPISKAVYPDESATVAFDFFQRSADDCLPVISRDEPRRLLGVVRRSDVRTILIRKRSGGGKSAH